MSDSQSTCEVEYREVAGYPGYRVGSDGSVWSAWARGGALTKTWKRLTADVSCPPYLRVRVSRNGKKRGVFVHLLVLEAFRGPAPDGTEGAHENGVGSDNRADNLKWKTKSENELDKNLHGTGVAGDANPNCKLTAEQVIEIRNRYSNGETTESIRRRFKRARQTISDIVNRKTWKLLTS